MAPRGIREEYLFPNDSVSVHRRHTRLGFISKKTTTTTESCTQCSCDVTV